MRKSLTQLFVDKINPPKSGRREYFDSHLTGFGLRVSAFGNNSWFVLYRVRGSGAERIILTHIAAAVYAIVWALENVKEAA
jgi:hypothetical protein